MVGVGGSRAGGLLKEKREAYECGFDPFKKKKRSFCIRFFNIAILYLLIDLEIALLLPFFLKTFLITGLGGQLAGIVLFLIVMLVLLLVVEWGFGGLDWKEEL
jgi:NADH-quinone oxidoreductase subunit A